MSQKLIHQKICLLGMFGVGKTSLTRRFVHNIYDDTYLSTIGVKVSQKLLAPIESRPGNLVQFNFLIWDIEGFDATSPQFRNYLVGAAGALIVADLSRPDTLQVIPEIIQIVSQEVPGAKLLLIGNKKDLISGQGDTVAMLNALGTAHKLPVFCTSAKTGENVPESFYKLGLLIAT